MSKIIDTKRVFISIVKSVISWHFKHYILGKDSPLIATFQLTNRCNFRCKMCNIINNPEQATLPLKTFKRIIGDLGEMGCLYISLSGGETLIIKDILSYVEFAKRKIPFVNMVTNGYLLNREIAKGLKEAQLDTLAISIDGLRETHDSIRGMTGSFYKAIEAIENIKTYAPQIRITINTVISPWNIDDLFPLVDLTEKMGVLHKFQPLNLHPSFDNQKTEYKLPAKNNIPIDKVKKLVAYLKTKKNVSNSIYFLSSIPDYFLSRNNNGLFQERCKLVNFCCEFREDGRMYPCIGGMAWMGGYWIENGIKGVYFSKDYREDVKRLKNCKFCQQSMSICYIEPRVTFPISSFIKYTLKPRLFM